MPACACCSHHELADLDAAIVRGESLRTIGQRYGVSHMSVKRHKAKCISPALCQSQRESDMEDRTTALERTERTIATVERILAAAEVDGKPAAALSAVAQLRPLIELLARLTHELDTRQVTNVFNLLSEPQVIAALDVIYSELHDQPELRQRIAARLQGEPLQIEGPQ